MCMRAQNQLLQAAIPAMQLDHIAIISSATIQNAVTAISQQQQKKIYK